MTIRDIETDVDAARAAAPKYLSEEEYDRWAPKQEFETEWVDGEVIVMAPISGTHDKSQAWLRTLLEIYVTHKSLGEVRGPEFQFRLRRRRREPDVLFVSTENLDRLHETYLDGPPDLAIEIVSPDSVARDGREKFQEYQSAGVPEYWIIDPLSQRIKAHALDNNKTYQLLPEQQDKIESKIIPGWYIRPSWLFNTPRKDLLQALKELGIQ